ncbi:PAS domain S-box protein [Methylovulum psychrotolerans]|uniref:PAS domain-containing protein n=1 Tax=Methylovulum psychrotolerans TaxID=1704499 RepID=UPI001BFFC4CF|nr:PAS domain-containing protein [Methylovulum psychrotolerans]MBT9098303.1 PAS domain S-box protein [Methylovulum psychrotolerans]
MKMICPAFLVSKLPVEPLRGHSAWRLLLAVLMPVFAAVLQWLLWPYLPPLTWLFLYPAVFISAWVGGFIGGLMATGVAITIGIYVFIPIQWSWVIQDPRHLYSALVFGVMGVMFSVVHGLLQTAYAQLRQIGAHNLDVSQSRLRLALEAAEAGLWEWDVRTNRNEWSSNLWGLYGLVPGSAEPSYELWLSSVHPDDREAVLKRLNEAVQSGTGIVLEWRVAGCPPGQERWLMSRGQADADADGAVTLYRGIVIDISSRKKLEQHLQDSGQRLNFALSTLQVGAWELDLLTHQSQRTALHDQIFGYSTPLDSWTYEQFLEHVVPEDRLGVHSCFQEATQTRSDWDFECRIRRADGVVRWIRAKGGHRLDPQGEPLLLAGIVEDIQNRKEAEQALVRKDQELLETQRLAGLGNWRWEVATDTHTWSEETYRIYGLDPALPALTYPAVQRLFTPETWAQLTAAVETALAAGLPYECDAEVLRADGGRRWITARGMAVRAADGTITSLYGTVQDITGRKQAELAAQVSEQALAASEREFRWLAESMPQIVWATDREGMTYYFNSQWCGYTGLGLAESYGDGWSIPFHPDERQQSIAAWHQAVHHNGIYSLESRLRRADGEYRWWLVRGVPVLDGSGAIYKWFGTCTDIHELKQAEESIRASEAYYRLIFTANPVPMYILDYETLMFLDVNSAALLKYGYTREEFLVLSIKDIRPETEIERTLAAIEMTLNEFDRPINLGEWQHKKKDGTLLWVQINIHALILHGRPVMVVLANDMTEHRRLLESLRASENLTRSVMNSLDSSIAVLDDQGTIIHVNQDGQNFSTVASYGILQPEDIGHNYFAMCRDSTDQQQATQILQGLQAVLNGDQARFSQEFLLAIGDGQRWFRLDVVPLQGAFKGLVTHLIDISGRKAIEDSLREQERLLAASQAIAHIGSWLLDIKTGQLRWSEETFRLFGLSSATDAPPNKEAFGELVYSDDRMAVQAWREALIAGGEPVSLEFRSRPINGQYRWLLAFAELEKDADGVPLRMIGAVQDITAQKRTAAELQRWADAFHYCAHGIVIGNPLTNGISFCNPAFASMQGYGDPSELVGLPIAALYPPEERAAIKPHLQVADTLGWISFESRYQHKGGYVFDI